MYKKNQQNEYAYLEWRVENPKLIVVINHGMAETPYRYNEFAEYLNQNNISVYSLFAQGHDDEKPLGHFKKNDFQLSIDNTYDLIKNLKKTYESKIVLFGHSMGSFMANFYAQKYSESIDGLVLCGSSFPGALESLGSLIANVIYAFTKDKTKPSYFMEKLSFGSFNKQFKPNRTAFDWLSKEPTNVDQYIASPLSGFTCSIGFYKDFLNNIKKIKDNMSKISKYLPILVIAGAEDPVGGNGEKVRNLFTYLKSNLQIKRVDLQIYLDLRHEILNEKEPLVYEDVLSFLNSI
jgi:alpha-beta hydrolase superfamily lysophospholipase